MKQINFKGLDWYVLEENNKTTKLLLKDVLDEDRIKKYCEDDKYREGNEVRHSFNLYPPFSWEQSYIRNIILPNFIKDLGIEVEATLLTKEEVEALPDDIRSCNNWYWTKSNASDEDDNFAYAWIVYSNGNVNYDDLTYASSVRPVLSLPSHLITSGDTGQMACSEELDIEHYDMFDYFTGYEFGGTNKDLLDHLERNFKNINTELNYLCKTINELKKGK